MLLLAVLGIGEQLNDGYVVRLNFIEIGIYIQMGGT